MRWCAGGGGVGGGDDGGRGGGGGAAAAVVAVVMPVFASGTAATLAFPPCVRSSVFQ